MQEKSFMNCIFNGLPLDPRILHAITSVTRRISREAYQDTLRLLSSYTSVYINLFSRNRCLPQTKQGVQRRLIRIYKELFADAALFAKYT